MKSSAEQISAYRSGLCIDCRAVPYSAGRPRCNACHDAYIVALTGRPSWTPPATQELSWADILGLTEAT